VAGRLPLGRLARLVRQRRFRICLNAIALLLVLVFLAYGVYRNWNELQEYQWTADYRYLLLAMAVYGLCFAAVLLAWHRIMAGIGAMRNVRVNARIFCYSSLPKRIPGVVWYIAGRAMLYQDEGVAPSVTVLGTILETMLLIVSGLIVYLASLLFGVSAGSKRDFPPAVALLLLIPLLAVLHPAVLNRVFGWLLRKLHYEGELGLTFKTSAGLVLTYCPAWILGGIDLYLLTNAVYPVPPRLLPAIVGAWAAAGAVSFIASYLIQGMGVTEVTLAALLSRFLPLPVSIVVAILFRLLLTVSEVGWALLVAWGLSGFKVRWVQGKGGGRPPGPGPQG
jgi:uncharacterized membrane protein YbhN (UPF0104 family)